jgi:hypothetical protein
LSLGQRLPTSTQITAAAGVTGRCYGQSVADGVDARKGTKSLDVILEEVRIERGAQLQHFDALDGKAGIVLGFSAAVAALAPSHHLVVGLGRLVVVLGALTALWTFLPRVFQLTNVYSLREKYLAAHPDFTKLNLLDAQISMMKSAKDLLEAKAFRLKLAMGFLALGVILVSVGIPIR